MGIEQAKEILLMLEGSREFLMVRGEIGWINMAISEVTALMLVAFLDSGRIDEEDLAVAGKNKEGGVWGSGHHRAWSKKGRVRRSR